MFKILDVYVGRTIITTILLVLAVFVGLSAVIKYVEQLRAVGEGSYDLLTALYFVVLGIPRDVELFFAMASLLGSLIGLGMLASSSELVVMQAAGISKVRIGLSVLKTAVPLMVIVMALGEWGAPTTQQMARDLRLQATSGGSIVSVRNGVWARDGNDFIFISSVNGNTLTGLNLWRFGADKKLTSTIYAETVDYVGDNDWVMNNVQITNLENSEVFSKQSYPTYQWETSLVPDKLTIVTVDLNELPISGLYDYMKYLKASEQDASRYELAFWRKATQPISVGVMMLMALSFVFGPLRSVTMGARILSGVVAGFTFYISSEFFGPLSLVYGIPPVFGALGPSLVFLLIATLLLRRKL
ncbi:lipopolysaccharide ABC transporter permease LptG [Vibrio sp. 10N.286.49.C2]|uniref:LPS export ABC transporter permease LptG n=1 Tax=unclassified Vibrio TaxID=2614977 RepID=UPI000C828017|nr:MULTISPECIES: LPS export ABC transporter permease LptG [unclassified Vibrio]PMH34252.1 lipopolysaccharide ABC transporter permease LptG [Vibrio sp. 10N.286.49.C2]PMH52889.1 lipopolysaccharide ABC transporter permease LptG [Vibrio sp. 10N.286.49.B1]PMH80183.1 lipopolysaccharide ABC transporter permease LptG [Vibrio sp. 10N.286.48.B7]